MQDGWKGTARRKIYYQSKWFTYLNLVGIFGWNLMRECAKTVAENALAASTGWKKNSGTMTLCVCVCEWVWWITLRCSVQFHRMCLRLKAKLTSQQNRQEKLPLNHLISLDPFMLTTRTSERMELGWKDREREKAICVWIARNETEPNKHEFLLCIIEMDTVGGQWARAIPSRIATAFVSSNDF